MHVQDMVRCRKLAKLYKRRAEHLTNALRSMHYASIAADDIDYALNGEADTRTRLRLERERLETKIRLG